MKTKNLLMMAAVATVALTACNKNDEFNGNSNFPADGVIRVATNVENPKSRAGLTTQNLNNIGFHVVNAVSSAYSYSNVKMNYANNVWNSEKMMLWQNEGQEVKIRAYSPYIKGANDITAVPFAVMADQSTEENIKVSDFVYQTLDFTPAHDLVNGKVNLNLQHVMSKLVVTIKLGTEFNTTPGTTTNPIESVSVNGTKVHCTLNFKNNASVRPQDLTGDAESVLMYQESYAAAADLATNATSEYQCILLPQTVVASAFTIDIFIKGKGNYQYTLSTDQTFGVGKSYSLTLNVGKDMVTAGNMTITEWVPGNGEGINHITE